MSSDSATLFSPALGGARGTDLPASAASSISVNPSTLSAIAIDCPALEFSDEDLLHQVGDGSKDALSVLFHRHAPKVLHVARRILRDDSEAEDLLQDLFVFLFQKAGLFDAKKTSGLSWIIQMTYHRAIDRRRYLGVRRHYDIQEFDEERQPVTSGQISMDEVAGRMLLHRLREELPAEQLQTLELYFFEGYSFHEIAEKTGQTYGNVRHQYYRGLERLRSYVFAGKHA